MFTPIWIWASATWPGWTVAARALAVFMSELLEGGVPENEQGAIPEDGHAANSGRHRRHRLKVAKSKTAPALAMAGSLLSPGPDPCRLSVLAKKPECPRCPPPSYLADAPRARGWTRGPQGVRGPDHWRRPPESLLGGSFKVRQEKRRKRKSGFVIRKAHNSIDLGKKN